MLTPSKRAETIANVTAVVIDSGIELADIEQVIDNLKSYKASDTKLALFVGQKVYVVQKTKKTLGTINKINKTRCKVDLPQGRYLVPLSMIEVAA